MASNPGGHKRPFRSPAIEPSENISVDEPDNSTDASGLSPYWPDNISQWSELIIRYADLREIPADLLAAQMYQESGGDPDATGAAGEIGLMQILGRYHPCASYDPEQNISCGTAILAGHYKATGDWNTALARYNAGTAGQSMGNGYVYADKIISMYEEAESER